MDGPNTQYHNIILIHLREIMVEELFLEMGSERTPFTSVYDEDYALPLYDSSSVTMKSVSYDPITCPWCFSQLFRITFEGTSNKLP